MFSKSKAMSIEEFVATQPDVPCGDKVYHYTLFLNNVACPKCKKLESLSIVRDHLEMLITADKVMLKNIRDVGQSGSRDIDNATDSMLQVTISQLESVQRLLNEV